jgi:hypothetical protein
MSPPVRSATLAALNQVGAITTVTVLFPTLRISGA